ncbi:hypothetical protein COX26_00900, partial [Candidatus Jorgensenbacteria bacterium CG23_combo_of_CG06-09_8_20_14_all_54_14]
MRERCRFHHLRKPRGKGCILYAECGSGEKQRGIPHERRGACRSPSIYSDPAGRPLCAAADHHTHAGGARGR